MNRKSHIYDTRQYMLSKDYEIFRYTTTDVSGVKLHHHDFYEIYLFLSGDITYCIEGKTYRLEPGDIILVNSKELHQALINSHEEAYERIVLWLDRSFLRELSSEDIDLSLCFESPERKNVLRPDFELQQNLRLILNKLISLERYHGLGRTLLYKAYIIEIMIHINNLVFHNNVKLDVDMKKNNLIDEILEYISNHIKEEITVNELSEHFFISKFHLSREFKKYTGTTLHRYIVQKKLIKSKELILKGSPISSVYKQCGFGDYSNFFRAFKNEYGFTPKQFYEAMTNSSS